MEYCPKSLRGEMNRGVLCESRLRAIVKDIGNALACLHSQNWAHLDIKPENILITSEGVHKLTDFGLSRFYGRRDLEVVCVKTADYWLVITCYILKAEYF